MRKNVNFLSFWLLLIMGMATVVFNCYGQKNDSEKEVTDPAFYDEGVVINGVKWATRNVDKPGTFAAKPEDSGMFYQWNRRVGWSATNPMINSDGGTDWDVTISEGTMWEKSNDPSPAGYRVPTEEEIESLLDTDKVSSEWRIQNGIAGKKFTDKKNGNSLFLPAAGFRIGNYGTLFSAGLTGNYRSSTQTNSPYAYYLYFNSGLAVRDFNNRGNGFSVRCVAK